MKAITVRSDWAMSVVLGMKTVEWRFGKTDYKGPLLICASADPEVLCISGYALCVVTLEEVVPFTEEHEKPAMVEKYAEGFAWVFSNAQFIEPFPVKGKRHLFNVDHEIKYLDRTEENLRKYYEPLIQWTDPEDPQKDEIEKEAHRLWEGIIEKEF